MKIARYKNFTVMLLIVAALIATAIAVCFSGGTSIAHAAEERTVGFYSEIDGELIASTSSSYARVAWKSVLNKLPHKHEIKNGVEGAYRFKEWVYEDGRSVEFDSSLDGYIVIDSSITGNVNVYATYYDEWEPYAAEVQVVVNSSGEPLGTPREPVKYTRLADAFDHYFCYGGNVKLLTDVTITGNIQTNYAISLDLNGKTLSSSGFTNAYMISVSNGYQSSHGFTIKDSSDSQTGKITGAKAGAIYHAADRRTLTIEGGDITDNSGDSYDNAVIYVYKNSSYDAGKIVISGGSISNNTTTAVKVSGYSNFEMNGGSISNNTANGSGGGVYFWSHGGFAFSGGEISRNHSGSYGGGIYIEQRSNNDQSELTMSGDARVAGNSSNNTGGGIYVVTPCTFVMAGGTIEGNSAATASGGGVCASGYAAVFDMRGGTIRYNTASNYGSGAYAVYQGKIKMSGGEITHNTASKYSYGGGVSFSSESFFEVSGTAKVMDNVKGVSVIENEDGSYALGDGSSSACNVYLTASSSKITVAGELSSAASIGVQPYGSDVLFTTGYKANNPSGNGGQFFSDKSGGSPNLCNGELTFANVYTVAFNVDGEQIDIEVIHGSAATYPNAAPTKTEDEGGVYAFDGWSESENGDKVSLSSIKKNMTLYPRFVYTPWVAMVGEQKYADLQAAVDGATGGTVELIANVKLASALSVTNTVTIDLKGHTVDRGITSANSNGHVIKVTGGNLTVKDTSDDKNGAITGGNTSGSDGGNHGGGIYVQNGDLTLESGSISNNTASSFGGGVYVNGGSFTMTGGKISNNIAKDNGGGVYIVGGTFTMTGGDIDGNTATCRGGGVYVKKDGDNSSFIMNGGTISNNKAMSDSDSKYGGGGVYIESGEMTLKSGSIINNQSYMSGGGIMLYSKATLNMTDGKISGNELKGNRNQYAGGVYMFHGCDFTMSGGEITDNSDNGVRLQYDENSFIMSGNAKIAGHGREGIYINGGTATMCGGSVEGNRYGGVYIVSGTFDMQGGSVGNNLTYNDNGGIYVYKSQYTTLKISGNSTIKNNYYNSGGVSITKNDDGTYVITNGKNLCNVYLTQGETITVAGELTAGENAIGVTLDSGHNGVVTSGYTGNGTDGSEFFSDTSGKVRAVENGEVKLAQAVTVIFMDGENELHRQDLLSGGSVEYSIDPSERTEAGGIYTFEKWVTTKDGDTEASLDNVTSNMTVYAKWSFTPYVAAIGEDKYTGLVAAIEAATDGQTVKMLIDIKLDRYLSVAKKFTLDLNGFKLVYSEFYIYTILVMREGDFTLTDTSNKKTGVVIGGGQSCVQIVTGGTFTMEGGRISETDAPFGGVFVNGGTFIMNGGEISGNKAVREGGGVYITDNGTFTMTDGVISDNSVEWEGHGCGGGVYVDSGTFTMTGGIISNNSVDGDGGGVYVKSGGTLHVSGAVTIIGNTGKDGAVDNVYTPGSIYITGALTDGTNNAQIGLKSCAAPVTSGYGNYKIDGSIVKPSTYFTQDDGGCVKLGEDNEVRITYGATSHSYVYTSSSDTHHIGTCSDCGAVGQQQVHNSDDVATCRQKKVCSLCGAEYGDYGDHDFDIWNDERPADCTHTGTLGHKDCKLCDKHFDSNNVEITDLTIATNDSHAWNDGEITTQPTCTDKGIMTFTCTRDGCGHTYTEPITANGHTWHDDAEHTDPTCTKDGSSVGICTVCDKHATQTIPALGHDKAQHEAKAATCTAIGWEAYETCSRCDYTTYVEIAAKGHSYGEWQITTQPTCTTAGEKTRICSHNGTHKETESIAAKGHSYGEWQITTQPTCTTVGEKTRICSHNGTHKETESIAAKGHSYDEFTVDKAATCTESGSKSKHCSECDEKSEITVIAPVPHKLTHHDGNTPTEQEEGNIEYWECDDCEKIFGDPTGATEITDKASVYIPKLPQQTPVIEPTASASEDDTVWVVLIVLMSVLIACEVGYVVLRKCGKIKFGGER